MSKRKSSALIKDILTCIEHISSYTDGLSLESFAVNYLVIEACLYNIQVIGEAVSNLPESLKSSEPKIPWILIKGMRNRLIHEYFGTDLPGLFHHRNWQFNFKLCQYRCKTGRKARVVNRADFKFEIAFMRSD